MTKLEEIADAIKDTLSSRGYFPDNLLDDEGETLALAARAAVEIMMTPSVAMLAAMAEEVRGKPGAWGHVSVYQAMLRAILNETPETE